MAIDKSTNRLSTTNAQGEKAANRYRNTQSEPEVGIGAGISGFQDLPSGYRSDFTDAPKQVLVEEIYQNVADGYRGIITVPGGATVKVGELTSDTTLAIMPAGGGAGGAWRRTSKGEQVEVNGAVLYLPIRGEGRGSLSIAETEAKAKRAIKIVVARVQKARAELDARNRFLALQENRVNLPNWAPGRDVLADEAVEKELVAARLGFRGPKFWHAVDLEHWQPGMDVDSDALIADELYGYRERFVD